MTRGQPRLDQPVEVLTQGVGVQPADLGQRGEAEGFGGIPQQLQDPGSQLSRYSTDPSLAPFLTSDPSQVQQYTSGVHREN